nr:histone-lysine N-methyltransferase SETD1A-like [Ipomoea batatas]
MPRHMSTTSSGRSRSTPTQSSRPPRYDLNEKYTPKMAVVTVAVGLPPSGTGSSAAMRSFPVSARPPTPATKISLGSKKNDPPKTGNSGVEVPVPTGLPLTATHPASPSGEKEASWTAKRGKEKEILEVEEVVPLKCTHHDGSGSTTRVIDVLMKNGYEPPAALLTRICAAAPPPEQTSGWSTELVGERIARDLIQMAHSVTDLFARAKDGDEIHRRDVTPLKKALAKRDQRLKELESNLKTVEETGKRVLEQAGLSEKLLTDPVLLAKHICRGRKTEEAVLAAISRTPIGEDLMYEFGTWAFTKGRRAIQNDIRAALEASVDEDDLPKLLAVLPEDVPNPGPTPFSKTPDE